MIHSNFLSQEKNDDSDPSEIIPISFNAYNILEENRKVNVHINFPCNLLMTLDGVMLRGIFEHKRLKPTIVRTNQGNVNNLAKLKQVMNTEIKLEQ